MLPATEFYLLKMYKKFVNSKINFKINLKSFICGKSTPKNYPVNTAVRLHSGYQRSVHE